MSIQNNSSPKSPDLRLSTDPEERIAAKTNDTPQQTNTIAKKLLEKENIPPKPLPDTTKIVAYQEECSKSEIPLDCSRTDKNLASEPLHERMRRLQALVEEHGIDLNSNTLPMQQLCKPENIEFIKAMIAECGVDVNTIDEKKRTLLHYACEFGNVELATILIREGARVDIVDKHQMTPLHEACRFGNLELVSMLIKEHGARFKANSHLLQCACRSGNIELVLSLIKEYGATVKVNSGILHHACRSGNTKLIQLLIEEYGANVRVIDKHKQTLLHKACKQGNVDLARILMAKLKMALGEHFNIVDLTDNNGRTSLHEACRSGNTALVRMLVQEFGANVNIIDRTDRYGKSPLYEGCQHNEEIVRILKEAGADLATAVDRVLVDCFNIRPGKKQLDNLDHLLWRLLTTHTHPSPIQLIELFEMYYEQKSIGGLLRAWKDEKKLPPPPKVFPSKKIETVYGVLETLYYRCHTQGMSLIAFCIERVKELTE